MQTGVALKAQNFPFRDTTLSVESRVDDLISRLTVDEKIAFLEHQNPAIPRLGIKAYSWWNEALHGVARNGIATVYPMPIAMAASFDPDLIERVFRCIADEAVKKHLQSQAAGEYGDNTGITFFTPNINIFRDPRWGRGMETFGEDPFLTAHMGLAAVKGLQGTNKSGYIHTAACLKHLAVHSGPEGQRHSFDAQITNRDLWTTYLPAFEYIINHSNVQQVMCGYNRLNGEPCCTNRHLLVDILRNRWRYDGILVTDCWALNDCWEPDTVIIRHRTHATAAQAAAAAFSSEVDLECGSGLQALKTALDSGYISEQQIDQHLRRLLRTRFRIRPELFAASAPASADFVAARTLVMLKNNGILPLRPNSTRIAVIGPNFADSAMTLGNYNGSPTHVTTFQEAFIKHKRWAVPAIGTGDPEFERWQAEFLEKDTNDYIHYYFDTACHLADYDYQLPEGFWNDIALNDVIVFCGGLSPALEGEELQVNLPGFYKGDRTSIELPPPQRDIIKEIKRRTGKPIILVLCTGSALGLEEIVDDVDAIIVAWYGGQDIGTAVHSAIIGYQNSFGRLPVTFYRSTSQLPEFDDYNMQNRTYRYMEDTPLYPFGYGLSYSHFHYENIQIDRDKLTLSGTLVLDSIDDGCMWRTGREVVQVYLHGRNGSKSPHKQLVAMKSIWLTAPSLTFKGGVSKDFSIEIDPYWLREYDESRDCMTEPKKGTPMTLEVSGGPVVHFVW